MSEEKVKMFFGDKEIKGTGSYSFSTVEQRNNSNKQNDHEIHCVEKYRGIKYYDKGQCMYCGKKYKSIKINNVHLC